MAPQAKAAPEWLKDMCAAAKLQANGGHWSVGPLQAPPHHHRKSVMQNQQLKRERETRERKEARITGSFSPDSGDDDDKDDKGKGKTLKSYKGMTDAEWESYDEEIAASKGDGKGVQRDAREGALLDRRLNTVKEDYIVIEDDDIETEEDKERRTNAEFDADMWHWAMLDAQAIQQKRRMDSLSASSSSGPAPKRRPRRADGSLGFD
jgi:hypothetical protein